MSKNNQSTPVYILKIVYPLVVICAIIALLVAAVNSVTAPVIEGRAEAERNAAIQALFANENAAIDGETTFEVPAEHAKVIDKISKIVISNPENPDLAPEHIGYCIQLSPNGFKGAVDLLAAFDTNGRVIGVDVTATNDETKGFGTRVNEPEYEGKFVETEEKVLPETVTNDYIISGATKTSKPVAQSIMTAKTVLSGIISKDLVEDGASEEKDAQAETEVETEAETETETETETENKEQEVAE